MSKKKKGAKAADAPQVNPHIDRVVSAYCRGDEAVASSGNIILEVCAAAKAVYKGEAVPPADVAVICERIAKKREWDKDAIGPRSSEVKTVLAVYARLPDATVAYKKKSKRFPWHAGMKLARALKKHKSQAEAVRVALNNQPKERSDIQMLYTALGYLKKIKTRKRQIIEFRKGVAKLCAEHELKY